MFLYSITNTLAMNQPKCLTMNWVIFARLKKSHLSR